MENQALAASSASSNLAAGDIEEQRDPHVSGGSAEEPSDAVVSSKTKQKRGHALAIQHEQGPVTFLSLLSGSTEQQARMLKNLKSSNTASGLPKPGAGSSSSSLSSHSDTLFARGSVSSAFAAPRPQNQSAKPPQSSSSSSSQPRSSAAASKAASSSKSSAPLPKEQDSSKSKKSGSEQPQSLKPSAVEKSNSKPKEKPNPIDRYVSTSTYFSHVTKTLQELAKNGQAKHNLLASKANEVFSNSNSEALGAAKDGLNPSTARMHSRKRMLAFALSVTPVISQNAAVIGSGHLPKTRSDVSKLFQKTELAVAISERKLLVCEDRSKWAVHKQEIHAPDHRYPSLSAVPMDSNSNSYHYHNHTPPDSLKRKWNANNGSDKIAIDTPEFIASTSLASQLPRPVPSSFSASSSSSSNLQLNSRFELQNRSELSGEHVRDDAAPESKRKPFEFSHSRLNADTELPLPESHDDKFERNISPVILLEEESEEEERSRLRQQQLERELASSMSIRPEIARPFISRRGQHVDVSNGRDESAKKMLLSPADNIFSFDS